MKTQQNSFIGVAALLLITIQLCAQNDAPFWQQDISGIEQEWHRIDIPESAFSKLNSAFSNIRVIGVTQQGDTIEAPYILSNTIARERKENPQFELINQVRDNRGFYYTFKMLDTVSLNQLNLKFANDNYEYKVVLEASQDQQEWYTILEDYRILSIQNDLTDYRFDKLTFPHAQYYFYRLFIPTQDNPELISASTAFKSIEKGQYKTYPVVSMNRTEAENNSTIVDLSLGDAVPLYQLRVMVNSDVDYYRKIRISRQVDSINTENGTKYNYQTIGSGVLSSLEQNSIRVEDTPSQKLRIEIFNNDNQPLDISGVQLKGAHYYLKTRFTASATYKLAYGKGILPPEYDLERFRSTIPQSMSAVTLGTPVLIEAPEESITEPLFKSRWWLWGLMILIIALIGYASLQMLRKKPE